MCVWIDKVCDNITALILTTILSFVQEKYKTQVRKEKAEVNIKKITFFFLRG